MKLNIGTLSIGNKTLTNVSLEGISPEDFLKLIESGNTTTDANKPGVKPVTPAVKAKPAVSKNVNTPSIPDDCVMGIMGIVGYANIDKREARLLQVAGLPVHEKIACDSQLSPKGVINLYLKSDIDAFIKKRANRKKKVKVDDNRVKNGNNTVFNKPTGVKITNKTTGEVYIFPSITKAAKTLKFAESTIWSALKKRDGSFGTNMLVEEYNGETNGNALVTEVVNKPIAKKKWITYNEYYEDLRKIIKDANKDMGKTLSEAYKDVTNVWGINWVQAKKDYRKAMGDVAVKTLRIAYWIEDNGIYNMSKGMLKESVERVLKKGQPPHIEVIKRV